MSTKDPSPTAIAPAADDAKRSRKGRTGIGIGLLLVGTIAAFGMVWLYANYGYLLDGLSERERSEAAVFDALNILFILALLGGGIWNIAARRTKALSPLIAALALSGMGLAFAVTNVLDSLMAAGKTPNVFVAFLYVGVLVQSIRLLRPTSTPAAPEAVL